MFLFPTISSLLPHGEAWVQHQPLWEEGEQLGPIPPRSAIYPYYCPPHMLVGTVHLRTCLLSPLGMGKKKRVLRGKVFLRSRSCTFRGGGRAGSGVRSRPRPAVPGKPRRKVPGSVRLRRPPRRCVRGAGRACGCAPGDAPLCVQRFCVSEAAPCCGWLSLSAGPCRSWSIRSVAIP